MGILWIPIIVMLCCFALLASLIIDTVLESNSPLHRFKEVKHYNKLYKCDNCEKMFRKYQFELYSSRHQKDACPHCEWGIRAYRSSVSPHYDDIYTEKVVKTFGWMNAHQDCLKLNLKDRLKINKTVRMLKSATIESKELEDFKKYNELSVDLKWIENLNKKR